MEFQMNFTNILTKMWETFYGNFLTKSLIQNSFQSLGSKVWVFLFSKKGDREDPNNYRGISILYFCSKIFTTVLNKWLNLWFETLGLIPEEQAGFCKGYSKIDNIFILQSIVQKCITKKQGKIYCKAFDSTDLKKNILLSYQ